MENPIENQSRREWFRAFGRMAALGGISLVGALALRKPDARTGDGCRLFNPCLDCSILKNCSLPKAKSAQQAMMEAPHEQA